MKFWAIFENFEKTKKKKETYVFNLVGPLKVENFEAAEGGNFGPLKEEILGPLKVEILGPLKKENFGTAEGGNVGAAGDGNGEKGQKKQKNKHFQFDGAVEGGNFQNFL